MSKGEGMRKITQFMLVLVGLFSTHAKDEASDQPDKREYEWKQRCEGQPTCKEDRGEQEVGVVGDGSQNSGIAEFIETTKRECGNGGKYQREEEA